MTPLNHAATFLETMTMSQSGTSTKENKMNLKFSKMLDPRYLASLCLRARKYATCHCCCRNGRPKKLYLSEAEAWSAVTKRRREGSGRLCPYKCRSGLGYHLTHHLHQWLPGMRRSWNEATSGHCKERV